MKSLIFSLAFVFVLFSNSASAETGTQVCQTMASYAGYQDCMRVIEGQYVDSDAGYVCIRARSDSGKLDCLRTSMNKEYEAEDVSVCAPLYEDSERISCMGRRGSRTGRGGDAQAKLETIRRLSLDGLRLMEIGNMNAAYQVFMRINSLSSQPKKD
jgi:hypothetical protein